MLVQIVQVVSNVGDFGNRIEFEKNGTERSGTERSGMEWNGIE